MITVTIHECHRDGRTWTHCARTTNHLEALSRAIRRHWGPRASLWLDPGLAPGVHGQIVRPVPTGGNTCLTDRVRVTFQ